MKRTFQLQLVKYTSTLNVAFNGLLLSNITKFSGRKRFASLVLGIFTLSSALVLSHLETHASAAKADNFSLGVDAYQHGWYPLALSYLRPVCVQKTLSKEITPSQHAMACYLVAHHHLQHSRYQQGETLLWRAITLAPANSPAAQPATLAALALRSPTGWYTATGQSKPTYKAVAPAKPETGDPLDADALLTGDSSAALDLNVSSGEDYLDEVMHAGQRLRWHPADSPLTLAVGGSSQKAKRFKQSYATAVNRAFGVWTKALSNRISVVPANNPSTADITVEFNDGLESNTTSGDKHGGITKPTIIGGQLNKMTITLRTANPNTGAGLTDQQLFSIALHEAGHALGLMGHSSQPSDVMFDSSKTDKLSNRDKRTIRRLYAEPATITSRPPSESDSSMADSGASASGDPLAAQQVAVAHARKELNQHPNNWLRWQNLGGSLLSLGKAQKQANNGNLNTDALSSLKEADTAFIRVAELDASQATAHLYRAYTLEEMNKIRPAIKAVDKAIAVDPTLAEAYREKAWLYAGVGDDIKAKVALNEYIRRNPSAKGSSDVAQIERRIAE